MNFGGRHNFSSGGGGSRGNNFSNISPGFRDHVDRMTRHSPNDEFRYIPPTQIEFTPVPQTAPSPYIHLIPNISSTFSPPTFTGISSGSSSTQQAPTPVPETPAQARERYVSKAKVPEEAERVFELMREGDKLYSEGKYAAALHKYTQVKIVAEKAYDSGSVHRILPEGYQTAYEKARDEEIADRYHKSAHSEFYGGAYQQAFGYLADAKDYALVSKERFDDGLLEKITREIKADDLRKEGDTLFAEGKLMDAEIKYREAQEKSEHKTERFNSYVDQVSRLISDTAKAEEAILTARLDELPKPQTDESRHTTKTQEFKEGEHIHNHEKHQTIEGKVLEYFKEKTKAQESPVEIEVTNDEQVLGGVKVFKSDYPLQLQPTSTREEITKTVKESVLLLSELSKTDPVLVDLNIAAHSKENVDRLVDFVEEGITYYGGEYRKWLMKKLPPVADGASDCERLTQKGLLELALALPRAGNECAGAKGGIKGKAICVLGALKTDIAGIVLSEEAAGCYVDQKNKFMENIKSVKKTFGANEDTTQLLGDEKQT